MDAQEITQRLYESFANDDLCEHPEIVDAVEDLADEYEDLKAENAKLRSERDHWHVEQVHAYGNWDDAHKYATKLKAENAELRELVWSLSNCAAGHQSENAKLRGLVQDYDRALASTNVLCDRDFAPFNDATLLVLRSRMYELGIEASK